MRDEPAPRVYANPDSLREERRPKDGPGRGECVILRPARTRRDHTARGSHLDNLARRESPLNCATDARCVFFNATTLAGDRLPAT